MRVFPSQNPPPSTPPEDKLGGRGKPGGPDHRGEDPHTRGSETTAARRRDTFSEALLDRRRRPAPTALVL